MDAIHSWESSMGINREDDDGSGDAWNRNPKPGGLGDFNKPGYLGAGLMLLFVVAFGVVVVVG